MPARLARIEAQPTAIDDVRRALEEMVRESEHRDPNLGRYELYESDETPGEFLIEQHITIVDEEVGSLEDERLMQLGTALREKLSGPIEIASYRLVAAAG